MMTKIQLRAAVERFLKDEKRIITIKMLCELAGISHDTLRNVFQTRITDITPTVQIRLERAFEAMERGEVMVVQEFEQKKQVQYRRKPLPEYRRGFNLTVKDGRIGLKTGLQNVNRYTEKTFLEELE